MSKLCLIKPWYLQPVHQRLEAIRYVEATLSLIPCTGPSGDCIDENNVRSSSNLSIGKPANTPISNCYFDGGGYPH